MAAAPGLVYLLLWPLLAFAVLNVVLIGFHGDRVIAGAVYAWEGGRWALQDVYATTTLIHVIGKRTLTLLWLVALAAAIATWLRPAMRQLRRPLLVLVISVAVSALAVSVLKHLTHMDCPWDLIDYGGTRPYFGLFNVRPAGLKSSGCFPSGHASAGYGWVALYFFLLAVAPRWRRWGLAFGIACGLVFGVSQQLRGAHFLSHDVWTAMICWCVAVLVARFANRAKFAAAADDAHHRATAPVPPTNGRSD